MKDQPKSGAVVLSDDLKSPAMEKLDLVRKWSINTYKVILSVLDLFNVPSLPCFFSQPSSQSLSSLSYQDVGRKGKFFSPN